MKSYAIGTTPRFSDQFEKDEHSHTYYEMKGSHALKTLVQIRPAPILAEVLSVFNKIKRQMIFLYLQSKLQTTGTFMIIQIALN